MSGEPITYADIAKLTGLTVNHLRVMNYRGEMPEADARPPAGARRNSPYWDPSTISDWKAQQLRDGLR